MNLTMKNFLLATVTLSVAGAFVHAQDAPTAKKTPQVSMKIQTCGTLIPDLRHFYAFRYSEGVMPVWVLKNL